MRFPKMPSHWVDFVNQNKAAESSIARLNVRRAHEAGRSDATEAANEGWVPKANAASPVRSETFDPIAMIDWSASYRMQWRSALPSLCRPTSFPWRRRSPRPPR
jgi:hypothetical protein